VTNSRIFNALNNTGLVYLSSTLASRYSAVSVSPEVYLEACWRSERWGHSVSSIFKIELSPASASSIAKFHHSIHQILSICSFRTFADPNMRRYLDQARLAALEGLGRGSLQSTKSVLPAMVSLRMVEDISLAVECQLDPSQRIEDRLERLVTCWEVWYRSMMHSDFKHLEPAMALHMILLKLIGTHQMREKHYCMVAKFAMKCNNSSYARSALQKLQAISETNASGQDPPGWWLRVAKLYWKDGKRDRASALLNNLQHHLEASGSDQDRHLLSRVLALNATWWASTRSKGWLEIEGNFHKSIELCENADCRAKLASFMDSLFSAEQEQADELNKQLKDLEKQKKELDQISKATQSDQEKEIKKAWSMRYKYLNFHEANLIERVRNKKTFLLSALENYFLCIDSSKKAAPAVFRVLHLWFEGYDDDDVNNAVLHGVSNLSSCRAFLIIVPQVEKCFCFIFERHNVCLKSLIVVCL
jgi:hypothetical protein